MMFCLSKLLNCNRSKLDRSIACASKSGCSAIIFAITLLVAPGRTDAQDASNTYSGQIFVSGTVGYVYPNFSAELQPTNYPTIIIHTTTGGVLSPQGYTISNSGAGNANFRIEWILNGVAASYAANSQGSPTTYYYPNDVRFAMSAYTDYTPRNPLVKMDLTNGSGGVLDTVYILFSTSGVVKNVNQSNIDIQAEGSVITWPVIHLYQSGTAPLGGREGIADRLSVKCKIIDERPGAGRHIQFRVGAHPYDKGFTTARIPAEPQPFEENAISEYTQGGTLQNQDVELWVDGKLFRRYPTKTPTPFPNHVFLADFGTVVLVCDTCANVCVAGKSSVSLLATGTNNTQP